MVRLKLQVISFLSVFTIMVFTASNVTPAQAFTQPSSPLSTTTNAPSWVRLAIPYVHISSDFKATLADEASKHLNVSDIQLAKRAIAEYNALPLIERSNDPSTHRSIDVSRINEFIANNFGCPQYIDQVYYVHAWYGDGIYYHFSQCYVLIGISAFAAASGIAWTVSAICALSIVGNAGCSEIAGLIAATLAAGGGILALWDASCNTQGVGMTYVESTWWHRSWAFPSC